MYLPTDAKTIYTVLIKIERDRRHFWTAIMGRKENHPSVKTITGRIWALMDLRDGSYIV